MIPEKIALYSQPLDPEAWVKSSASASGNTDACVEIQRIEGGIAIRDSKNPDGPVLRFTDAEVAAFRTGWTAGEFDHIIKP